MVITLTLWQVIIVGLINISILAFLVYDWFRKNYTVVDLETWNTVVDFYNENANQEDNELASGVGFFRECLYEEDGESDEPEEEEESEE